MTILRNLTVSDILLNDLGGIVIPASSDYDLNESSWNNIANSKDLANRMGIALASGTSELVFVDTEGNELSQQQSLDMQKGISTSQPALLFHENGIPAAGGVHDTINFVGNAVRITSTDNRVSIGLLPGLEFNTIGGEQILTLPDATRGGVKLSVEKARYLFINDSVSDNTWFWIMDTTNPPNAFVVPFNATLVAVSTTKETGESGSITMNYDLYVDNVLHTTGLSSTSGSAAQSFYDDTLNISLSANQTLKMRGALSSGSGTQTGVAIALYLRWRV